MAASPWGQEVLKLQKALGAFEAEIDPKPDWATF